MLTPRQHAVYEFIADVFERKGSSPSYDEIRRHFGLRSLNAVAKLVTQLRRRGALADAPHNAKRSLRPVMRRRAPRRAVPVRSRNRCWAQARPTRSACAGTR